VKQVDESFNEKEIDLATGESLEVRLRENRTTGYKWIIESSASPECALTNDAFEAADAIGQPGTHLWEFRAERAGAADIKLSYRRPWEENQRPAASFALHVRVGP
jgi:inhibitor of cysteine peptidase